MGNRLQYTYVSDYAVVIITANNKEEADEIFNHELKYPLKYKFEPDTDEEYGVIRNGIV